MLELVLIIFCIAQLNVSVLQEHLIQCVYQDCVPSSNADNLEILLLSQVKSNYTSNLNYGTSNCLILSQMISPLQVVGDVSNGFEKRGRPHSV